MKEGLKSAEVPKFFSQLNKVIKGLLFTDQADPAQNLMANQIIRSFYNHDLGIPHTQNFHKYLDYVSKNWFHPNSVHFVGKLSNFHREILTAESPQLTNNCSESLNSALKSLQKGGYIPKRKCVGGLRDFFLKKRLQMVTFTNGKKIKNRNPKDLEKFRKMKVLSTHLEVAMHYADLNEEFKCQVFYEIAFKFGNIHSHRLIELFQEQHPLCENIIPEL